MAALGLCAAHRNSRGERGLLFAAGHWLLTVPASLVAEHTRHTGLQQLQLTDLAIEGLGLSYSEACGIFSDHDLLINMVLLYVNLLFPFFLAIRHVGS